MKFNPLYIVVLLMIGCNNQDNKAHHTLLASSDTTVHHTDQKKMVKDRMQEMDTVALTGNNDADFSRKMIVHHKAAIEMAKLEIANGTDDTLKQFARSVEAIQGKEILWMKMAIAKAGKTVSANSAAFQSALDRSMMAMTTNAAMAYHNTDKDFAAQMIPHHRSAVDMAKIYIAYGRNEKLRAMSYNIIRTQTNEIAFLKDWLSKRP